jgi:hypothetical protein
MSKKLSAAAVCYDFEFVCRYTVRIKIFGGPRVEITESYRMRTEHVMFVEGDDNY